MIHDLLILCSKTIILHHSLEAIFCTTRPKGLCENELIVERERAVQSDIVNHAHFENGGVGDVENDLGSSAVPAKKPEYEIHRHLLQQRGRFLRFGL